MALNYTPANFSPVPQRPSGPQYSPSTGYGTQLGSNYFVQTPMGGQWSATPASSAISTGVLGTSDTVTTPTPTTPTNNTSTGIQPNSSSVPTWLKAPGMQFSNDQGVWELGADGQLKFMGTHADRAAADQARLSTQISDQYQPEINALNDFETQTKGAQSTALLNSGDEYNRLLGQLPGEKQQYMAGVDLAGQNLGENTRSAYDQAIAAYNALNQNRNARFGAGSSAGQAIGEVAGQQFFRSQGLIGQANVQQQGQIEQERLRLNNYIKQKEDTLTTARTQAEQQINSQFQNQLAQIGLRKGDIESNKTRDKLAALQLAIADSRAIKATDQQLRRDLATFAAQQYATVQGMNFTPQGLNTSMQAFGLGSPYGIGYRPAQDQNAFRGLIGSTGQKRDEFGNIIG